jgi:hypothetical protein
VDVGADDDKVVVEEMEEVVVVNGRVNVDKELELDTDAGGSPGVTVHCRTTCTTGWPFGPLIGVNVMLHISVTGPAALQCKTKSG